jgi:translation initiation factor 1A
MPPNSKGGKGYKKKKKTGDAAATPIFIDTQEDQMLGRVIRLLGNRNVLCFCLDNILRICHICGRMKGRVWIEPGDLVLVSLRELSRGQSISAISRGDVIGKYVPEQFSALRKQFGQDAKVFMKLETMDGLTLNEIGVDLSNDKKLEAEAELGGFTFEAGEDESSDSDSSEGAGGGGAKAKPRARGGRAMEAVALTHGGEDGDIDIDAI